MKSLIRSIIEVNCFYIPMLLIGVVFWKAMIASILMCIGVMLIIDTQGKQ